MFIQTQMAPEVPPAVAMFNTFTRELVLLSKKHCTATTKAALKKRFKLFDPTSPKHAHEFLQRRAAPGCEGEVFEGIGESEISQAVPEETRPDVEALVAGMTLAASLLEDEVSDSVVAQIATAILERDLAPVETLILDESLSTLVSKASGLRMPERVSDDLSRIAERGRAERGSVPQARAMGIVGLAEEISREIDISSLMGGPGLGGGNPGLESIINSINQKVQGRIRDGTVDPEKLCSEAQSILGNMSS